MRTAVLVVVAVASIVVDSSADPRRGELAFSDLKGQYLRFDGISEAWHLEIREDKAFVSRRLTGVQEHDSRQPTQGTAALTNGLLYLVGQPSLELVAVLRPVQLEKRLYLVPAGEELAFCLAFAEGQEPRSSLVGTALLRKGDERRAVQEGHQPGFCSDPSRLRAE
jgi:hypothetical protein